MPTDQEKQIAEAEAILGDRLQERSFVKGLFFGEFLGPKLPRYPHLGADTATDELVGKLRAFCGDEIDPVAIDRQAEIPARVIEGLGSLGILGACLPRSCGGLDMTQTSYCQLLEVLGHHCASTALFVNAHHSIGPRAIVLFGNEEQKTKWLPKLATGEWISAFALTEPEAGSDAANVQTTASPTEDGAGFKLNGQKRWITNGGIARVLTVMARTPVAGSDKTQITAFLVTPDMQGFEVTERSMEKCGCRGTVTSRLTFRDCFVPRENILGPLGKGLKVALTVLDFGRTTFGASCTGAAKFCLERVREHVQKRVQFQRPLVEFELVKEKIADIEAAIYAMEATTYQTAALIDSGAGDFMLETAILKVFATETLWQIIYDTFQLHGGLAYFTDQPWERMMRDHRIDMIGEGANEVLRVFTALVGMRDVGLELESILNAFSNPVGNFMQLARFAGRQLGAMLLPPPVPVHSPRWEPMANRLGRSISQFASHVQWLLRTYQKGIVEKQLHLTQVATAINELYASACVLRRLESEEHFANGDHRSAQSAAAERYLRISAKRITQALRASQEIASETT